MGFGVKLNCLLKLLLHKGCSKMAEALSGESHCAGQNLLPG